MKFEFLFFITFIAVLLVACTSTKETTDANNSDGDAYIFDNVPASDSYQVDNAENESLYNFYVQIGAFSSRKSAEDFAEESEDTINKKLAVTFNSNSNFYTVKLKIKFNSRIEAEKVRNELWQNDKFKDAWIIKEPK